jgi:hypothetical protein
MKLIYVLTGILGLATAAASAESPVTVMVDTKARGYTIPPDFIGVSIFTATQARDHRGVPGNLFSGTNAQLITIFKNAGIHHVRLGATGSPTSDSPNLNHADIDALFAFAKATGIKVIYSLHYAQGPETAKYVWDNYRPYLDCFAFDNEPDGRLNETNGSGRVDYFTSWKEFAQSVTNAVPGAKFAGPDAAGRTLVAKFVRKEKDSGCLALVTQHTYVGGNPIKRHIDRPHAIDAMLSKEWVETNYPQLYKSVLKPLAKHDLPFRITELDDYVHGVTNASDAFCSALWALDAAHWFAAHGAAGVNFQNTEWLHTDTFHLDEATNYQIYPRAYGIRAFEEGSHGSVEPVEMSNAGKLNLTAYAVGDAANVYVTIVNKEHGDGARGAEVSIKLDGFVPASAAAMFLSSPNGDVGATSGMTFGGGTITNNAPWHGEWTKLKAPADGVCSVTVPATSAAVVKLTGNGK